MSSDNEANGEESAGNDSSARETGVGADGSDLARSVVGTAVAWFVVLGVGFVFTFFFAAQFSTGGGFGSGFAGVRGLGFAVALSPVLAVVVGVLAGRREGSAGPDAAVGSALGFVVMYFVTLVVASSLESGTPTTGGGLGPLAGFTVGVGLTAAVAAEVTRRDAAVGGVAAEGLRRPLTVGVGCFAAYAVGFAGSLLLADAVAGGGPTGLGGGLLGSGVAAALNLGVMLVPVVGLVVGVLAPESDTDERTAAVGSGIAAAVGAVLVLVAFYAVVFGLAPGGVTAGEFPVGTLVGLGVGTGLTGAGGGYVGSNR